MAHGTRTVHTVYRAATFPWRSHGDTVTRFAYNSTKIGHDEGNDDRISGMRFRSTGSMPLDAVSMRTRVAHDRNIDTVRLCDYPYSDTFRHSAHAITTEWWCDVSIAWSHAVSPHDTRAAIKLLDQRFDYPRYAWVLIFDVMDWCERTYAPLGVYPVRRSVWNMLILPATIDSAGVTCSEPTVAGRIVSSCGLVNVGDLCAYAYTLRILVLTIYLGCSYGGMARAASVNDRVSNRAHRCVFPAKTSGVYHSLFHTSVLPHRLFC